MHVGIILSKLDAGMRFYGDLLGFREFWRGSEFGTKLSWVNLRVPDGLDYVEFMLFKEVPPPPKRGTAHHICLEVPDVNVALATLNARPYPKEYARPIEVHVGVNRKRIINVFDPDGTRLELMEPATIDGKPTPSSTAPSPNLAVVARETIDAAGSIQCWRMDHNPIVCQLPTERYGVFSTSSDNHLIRSRNLFYAVLVEAVKQA